MRQVAAAVIIENGRLLLARRAPGEKLAGQWELPGGKVEPEETPQRCLERELMEELQMAAVATDVLARTVYRYDHGCFELLAVGAVRQSDYTLAVHDSLAWVEPQDLGEYVVAPADVQLLDILSKKRIW